MDRTVRRREFLRSKLEELTERRRWLNVMLCDGSLSAKARALWAKRLDFITEDIAKRTAELTDLEIEKTRRPEGEPSSG